MEDILISMFHQRNNYLSLCKSFNIFLTSSTVTSKNESGRSSIRTKKNQNKLKGMFTNLYIWTTVFSGWGGIGWGGTGWGGTGWGRAGRAGPGRGRAGQGGAGQGGAGKTKQNNLAKQKQNKVKKTEPSIMLLLHFTIFRLWQSCIPFTENYWISVTWRT